MNALLLLSAFLELHSAGLDPRVTRGTSDPQVTTAHVRALEPPLALLVQDGIERSPTFGQLVRRIDETNGIVYVHTGACSSGAVAGCLLLNISEVGHARYLNIHLTRERTRPAERIAIIGHELQHANEVLSRSWVRTSADAHALFMRIGSGVSIRSFETDEAHRIESLIREELARADKDRRRCGPVCPEPPKGREPATLGITPIHN